MEVGYVKSKALVNTSDQQGDTNMIMKGQKLEQVIGLQYPRAQSSQMMVAEQNMSKLDSSWPRL